MVGQRWLAARWDNHQRASANVAGAMAFHCVVNLSQFSCCVENSAQASSQPFWPCLYGEEAAMVGHGVIARWDSHRPQEVTMTTMNSQDQLFSNARLTRRSHWANFLSFEQLCLFYGKFILISIKWGATTILAERIQFLTSRGQSSSSHARRRSPPIPTGGIHRGADSPARINIFLGAAQQKDEQIVGKESNNEVIRQTR